MRAELKDNGNLMKAAFSEITAAISYVGMDAIILSWKAPGLLNNFELFYSLVTGNLNSWKGPKRGEIPLGLHFVNSCVSCAFPAT